MLPPLAERWADAVPIEDTWYLCCHLSKFQFSSLGRSGMEDCKDEESDFPGSRGRRADF